ncbi:response regulator transcription factor [Streptomyces litchfieldiae]|uniref:Response regulator transcription factor n=1 Tax=Streptomyces litchfieldiae TaxID=3075543 RepID=A0ABU2MQW0_9ACTN|nr:response regulator transcription factor [Streptomyces sp. DSM 44938]MDT0344014.1 response regulator transcription factor [Streptomyces sp. DSM 44938]
MADRHIDTPRALQVLLAEDEPLIRAGVRAILTADPGIDVVAEAGDGQEAVELARRHRPDVAVLDIRMPRMDGLSAAAELRRTVPESAVVILTTFGEDAYISRALDSGATGFLLKTGDPRELVAGVRAAADGAAYLSPQVTKRVITRIGRGRLLPGPGGGERIAALSAREREVLALLGSGLSNAEIGRRLHLTEGTVKTHVSAILGRLGIRNRVQAALIAYEAGMVERLAT